MHVLIATDGSRTAVDAARVVDLIDRPDHVTLLAVLTSLPGENVDELDEPASSPEEQARQWETAIREANRELARTAAVLSTPPVDTRVDAGDVASTITRVAREVDADVIVLGTHARHGLQHLLRRSVAERVVRNARCMVLVVPESNGGSNDCS
jgi:nucleotide-binding universal stress UspA family protein